jgi:hypothetical protein
MITGFHFFCFGVGMVCMLLILMLLSWSMCGDPPRSATWHQWYKIQERIGGMGCPFIWTDCLWNGKPSHFPNLPEAASALADTKQYPIKAGPYRLVRVTEQVVSEAGELL